MKTKLATIILCVTSVAGFSQQFNGTVFDLDTGRIQVINGNFEQEVNPYQPIIDTYRRISAETQASIDRMRAESIAREQAHQLRMQTEYLRQIAERK